VRRGRGEGEQVTDMYGVGSSVPGGQTVSNFEMVIVLFRNMSWALAMGVLKASKKASGETCAVVQE
jgi:hypothetical protein